jgi:NMT1-like family
MVSGMPDMTHNQPAAGVSRRGLLAAGVLVMTGAECASAPSAVRSGIEKPELMVGAVGAVTAAGLYVAQQRGFFAARGLTVTIVPTTGSGPVMGDLLSGRLDVSFGNYVSFIAALARRLRRWRRADPRLARHRTHRSTGMDLSSPMLERAAATCAALRLGNVTLARADASEPRTRTAASTW